MRGGEGVLEELLPYAPEAPIYTLFHFPGQVSELIESHPIVTSPLSSLPGARANYRKLLPLFPRAIERFDLSDYDLVISTSHCVAKGARTKKSAYHLCYCHTPMRYVWDQQREYFPDERSPLGRLRAHLLSRLRRWDADTADRVDQYVANSNFVAWRIREYYGREAQVVHPPVDVDFFTPDSTERADFGLAVSALAPYKRLDLAIQACAASGTELRIVGDGPERASLERLAQGTRTRFLGRVSAEELRQLYRSAAFFIQPGTEDFGIAPVEALATGLPVVALGRGGVLDIVEEGVHGMLVAPPGENEDFARAIDKIRKIRFNESVLRRRSEDFSAPRFRERMGVLLDRRPSDLKGRRS